MRVIITGSREYTNKEFVYETLNSIHAETPITMLVHGDCRGVDELAAMWANENNVQRERYPIHRREWKIYGRDAGAMRNERIAKLGADLCLSFPGGNNTNNMKKIAEKHNIPIREI